MLLRRLCGAGGIPLSEIEQLEQVWNNGNPFPIALRELLFLAGNSCYVLDYGWFDGCGQQMQVDARQWMTEEGMERTITRPFYIIEVRLLESFLMVYLDEGDNPYVRNVFLPHEDESSLGDLGWLYSTDRTLKNFIDSGIDDVKKGHNPF
ncbi:hypothetical protein [Flavobacterium lacus]|uniref:hypothetical protein n=1 Tax=Flavobacterium lacus TaxID=1353778 RepID=UPI000DD32AF1|nr:hypothetical protein [Flavobacterium lacus]